MPSYDSLTFDPPAPVAHVALRDPTTGKVISDVPLLLDTGSDVTLLPLSSVLRLGTHIETETNFKLEAFDGTRSDSHAVELHVVFDSMIFRGKFLLTQGPVGVLGRDVLNLLLITLNGAKLEWNVAVLES